ncbi:MAG: hypothetical protein ABI175_13295 [Polyangiales bacterium]
MLAPPPRRRPAVALVALALALPTITMACNELEHPPPAPTPASLQSTSSSAKPPTPQPIALPSAIDAGADATVVATDAGAIVADAAEAYYATDGAPLGQTDAFPSLTSAGYQDRIRMLWDAIVKDEPGLATPAFFPLVAYEQVKNIPKPAIDHERRLLAAFARDIHAYHAKLGKDPAAASFVRIDVPEAKAKWMEPGSEGNKLGYDRVLDSKLVFKRDDGTEVKLDVKSMISWRGEWYVVHLARFK